MRLTLQLITHVKDSQMRSKGQLAKHQTLNLDCAFISCHIRVLE